AMTTLLASLLLAAATVVALVAARRPPRLEIEPFPSEARRALALALFTSTLALACFAPLLEYPAVDPTREVEDVPFGALFLGHGLLTVFLVAWWLLSGRPAWRDFLRVGADGLRDGLRVGAVAGAAG